MTVFTLGGNRAVYAGWVAGTLPEVGQDVVPAGTNATNEKPAHRAAYPKRLMGLEPTTFCMAIVCTIRISAG